jgi:hypothetical protein
MRELGGSYSVIAIGLVDNSLTVSALVLGTTYEFIVEA